MEKPAMQMCNEFNTIVISHIQSCKECKETMIAISETGMFKTLMLAFGSNDKLKEIMSLINDLKKPETLKLYKGKCDE